ncbi:MAG: ribonuclease HI [Verrucomicrobiota bacterium]
MKRVTIYTDGACEGNPGPGGWAAVLEFGAASRELCGGSIATTNNRMEMQAALEALLCLKEGCEVDLYTDSEYLREGITKWIKAWKAKGWKKKVKNADLWKALDEATRRHSVTWHWVKGHAGNPGNERCDVLATTEAKKFKTTHSSGERAAALDEFLARRTLEMNPVIVPPGDPVLL